ncbi:hypothetical protein F3C89_24570, partial [Bacteroides ovatus]
MTNMRYQSLRKGNRNMQDKVSIKRKCYLLSVLLMTVWLTGCVQEEFESTPSPAGNGIRFTLTVPDV